MGRKRVFVTRRLPIEPSTVLGPDIEVSVFGEERAPTREELLAGASGVDALVSLLSERIDESVIAAMPGVRVIANVAVGYNNIDVEAATRAGVWVTNTPGVLTEATADCTWALLLAVARRVCEGDRMVRDGRFGGWSPTMLLGVELRERTLGIFGFGRIGRAVARRAGGFGMEVIYATRSAVDTTIEATRVDKSELLARADVVSIHCPLNDETRHAFSHDELAAMKPTALLINTARGPIVDEAALVQALEAGQIAGAGLDVYEDEPAVHPGLLGRDDVVLLPHIASATRRTREAMARMALENARAVLEGNPPPDAVNDVAPT